MQHGANPFSLGRCARKVGAGKIVKSGRNLFDLFACNGYNIRVEKSEVQTLTPVAWAFIGDAVHTLYIRERTVSVGVLGGTLHAAVSAHVNASAQAAVFDALAERGAFTDEEADVARRAKNAHLHSRAKGATLAEYHKATALEAVIGYLYLCGETQRVNELLALCAELGGI